MRENWEIKTLAEVAEVLTGATPSTTEPKFWNGNLKWITPAEVKSEKYIYDTNKHITELAVKKCSLRLNPKGTVIFSSRAPIGKVAIAGEDMYCNQGFKNFNCKKDIIFNEFLYYFLVFSKDYIESLGKGTTFKEVSKTIISKVSVPVPPLSEQTAIVEKLDLEFAKIDLLKNNAQKQLDEAKALFQSTLKQLLEPKEGWEEKRLEEVCSIVSTLVNPTDKEYRKMLHVGGANIVSEKGVLVDLKSVEDENLVSGKFYFKNNVVLYNKIRPYLKKAARPNFNGLCSADMYPLTPNELISRDFLYYILISDDFTNYAIKNSARAGMPKINRNSLFAYSFKMPKSIQCQIDIGAKLDAISSKIKKLEENYKNILTHCDDLKQAILREIFG